MYNSPTNHRYDGIQALRFLASFIVVLTHSTFYAVGRLGAGGEIWHNGSRGVDIFFVISGVVMVISTRRLVGSEDGWKTFASKRVLRTTPLYWIATTFKVVTVLLMSGLVLYAEMDWGNIIKSYFYIPYLKIDGEIAPFLGVGWTLVFEMFFYLIFTAALFLKKNVYAFAGAVLLIFSALSLFRGETHSAAWFLADPIILEFYMGMVIGYFALKRAFWPTSVALVAGLSALAFMIFSTPIDYAPLPRFLGTGIPAAILVWSTMSLEKYLHGRIPRSIMFFAGASYALYLFHPLIAPFAPLVLNKLSIQNFNLSVVLSTAISMVTGAVVYQWVERPVNNVVNGYLKKSAKQPVATKQPQAVKEPQRSDAA